ncbi:MAG: polysaccharide deacetylase family protein [Alphaproteobacteria bacterium]
MNREPNPWQELMGELDAWAGIGAAATFWWRDDDARAATPGLTRLLETASAHDLPLALAVVPAGMTVELGHRLRGRERVSVLQHGYAHVNHARQGEGAWELGSHRPARVVMAELREGCRRLREAFGGSFVPVLVPPWNRIDPELLPRLPEAGLHGLSTFGARAAAEAAPGVAWVNTHCDPIKWKGGARFTGTEAALDDVVTHLRARRDGAADPREPTGLVTHHLDLDEAGWEFVIQLLERTRAHGAARWVDVAALVGARGDET